MNFREELILRCASRRRQKLGQMSDAAYQELLLAVKQNPEAYVNDPAEKAYVILGKTLRKFNESARDDDLLDDDQYMAARAKRFEVLAKAYDAAIELDAGCLDAHLLRALATIERPDKLLDALLDLEEKFKDDDRPVDQLEWGDVWSRPRLRLRAAVARTCGDAACWKMARDAAESVLRATEKDGDPLGARNTAALAYARLEDEEGLNALEARWSQGNAWSNLARCLLLYKLGRMPAARRALRGYGQLTKGAAYALLKPMYVEVFLPDRPELAPGSFDEALAAVHEAEVIIADTPDFIAWCQTLDWFEADARAYAEKHDLDW